MTPTADIVSLALSAERFPAPFEGVYLLFAGDELVYVGQSNDIVRRVGEHRRDKQFDSYSWVGCPEMVRNYAERKLIQALNPTLMGRWLGSDK